VGDRLLGLERSLVHAASLPRVDDSSRNGEATGATDPYDRRTTITRTEERTMPDTKSSANSTTNRRGAAETWTAEERAAMKEHARELKAAAKKGRTREDGEAEIRAKIAEMPEADRVIAERFHAIVSEVAPDLVPRTWYGMPAYAKDGKVLGYLQAAAKFKARYATIGFDEVANLDDGTMWPTSWAVTKLTKADEEKVAALVKQAVS
jgi:uncharacterized protein YdhG (YjbR/CyaY superfamily)